MKELVFLCLVLVSNIFNSNAFDFHPKINSNIEEETLSEKFILPTATKPCQSNAQCKENQICVGGLCRFIK